MIEPGRSDYTAGPDIPADSPYHRARTSRRRQRSGVVGLLITAAAFLAGAGGKLLPLLYIFKSLSLLSFLASLGLYAAVYGPAFGIGLAVMILLHELGHVFEIRRQGMRATAPLFIPFLGAAIFQRSHPTTAVRQAQIGIAGPIAGTIAASAALALYSSVHVQFLAQWALIGLGLNLFNLIPLGMLDGGWVLTPVTKYAHLLGLAIIAAGVFYLHVFLGPILIIVLLFSFSSIVDRFRNARSPYYTSVPVNARLALFGSWVVLVGYLVLALRAVAPIAFTG